MTRTRGARSVERPYEAINRRTAGAEGNVDCGTDKERSGQVGELELV